MIDFDREKVHNWYILKIYLVNFCKFFAKKVKNLFMF